MVENQTALVEFQEHGEETHDEFIHQGWVEALEFVLGEEEPDVDEDVLQAFNMIADVYLGANFYDGNISHSEDVYGMEEEWIDELDKACEGWHGTVVYGDEGEGGKEVYYAEVFLTKDDYEKWKADDKITAPKFYNL